MTNDERMQRESSLIATIRTKLPEFAKACADGAELVLLHQDAFAADYQEDEYTLLGMAIKYAGLRGPDYDFGSGPNEITYIGSKGKSSTIIGAGQKSGIYYALNPDTGAPLWQTQVGPGSALGGMEWGSASDGTRIYVAIANDYGIPTPLGTFAGLWAALDPANNGKVLRQTADPNGSIDIGPLAVANGVVYASSMGQATSAQNMVAMNAATGAILWSFAPGVSVNAGATVVNGVVYWGSGYNHLYLGSGNNDTFYAFSVNGN